MSKPNRLVTSTPHAQTQTSHIKHSETNQRFDFNASHCSGTSTQCAKQLLRVGLALSVARQRRRAASAAQRARADKVVRRQTRHRIARHLAAQNVCHAPLHLLRRQSAPISSKCRGSRATTPMLAVSPLSPLRATHSVHAMARDASAVAQVTTTRRRRRVLRESAIESRRAWRRGLIAPRHDAAAGVGAHLDRDGHGAARHKARDDAHARRGVRLSAADARDARRHAGGGGRHLAHKLLDALLGAWRAATRSTTSRVAVLRGVGAKERLGAERVDLRLEQRRQTALLASAMLARAQIASPTARARSAASSPGTSRIAAA
jgi:hypothetical protein